MTLFSDFLSALEVPHTVGASDAAFKGMTFKSLFGFSRLLASYGIPSEALKVSDKSALGKLPVPCVAQLNNGFVIVNSISSDAVDYTYFGKRYTLGPQAFEDKWTGVVLIAYPQESSAEPDYRKHRFYEIAAIVKKWLLIVSAAVLVVYGFIEAGLWRKAGTVCLTLINFAGIGVTWLLILKSLKVSSPSADRICGILKEHGCDTVLEQKASKFFGLFGWSEVGFAYFTISTAILFLFPGHIGSLALINACCLPFTLWSIWYQHFRLHTWCTLCVITQCLLWLQFFCFLLGGLWHGALPIRWPLFAMGFAYLAALLALNRVMTFIEKRIHK